MRRTRMSVILVVLAAVVVVPATWAEKISEAAIRIEINDTDGDAGIQMFVDGDEEVDPDNTVVQWQPVADPPGSRIVGYEVIVIQEEPSQREMALTVGPDTTRVRVPRQFMESGAAYKYEVLAIEKSGNQTISEAEFETE